MRAPGHRSGAGTRGERAVAARPERGFTLIEVILAVAILSTIVVLLYSSLQTTIATRDTIEKTETRYHLVRLTLNRMAREIGMAYLSLNYQSAQADPPTRTLFKGEHDSPVDELTFTSLGHLRLFADAKESDQNVVQFYGERTNDGNGARVVRREKVTIGDEDENTEHEGGSVMTLSDGIESLRLEYWDIEKKEWVNEWDSTDVDRANRLPGRVRITLEVPGPRGKTEKFTTQTRIFMAQPICFTRSGSLCAPNGPPGGGQPLGQPGLGGIPGLPGGGIQGAPLSAQPGVGLPGGGLAPPSKFR